MMVVSDLETIQECSSDDIKFGRSRSDFDSEDYDGKLYDKSATPFISSEVVASKICPCEQRKDICCTDEETASDVTISSNSTSASTFNLFTPEIMILTRAFRALWNDPSVINQILLEDYSKLSDKIQPSKSSKLVPPSVAIEDKTKNQNSSGIPNNDAISEESYMDELQRLQNINEMMEEEMIEMEEINNSLHDRITQLQEELTKAVFKNEVLEKSISDVVLKLKISL
eukprot:CAMPEP_0172428218 /NCGR_PEP_ID=MMETSP1064-20121228/45528_1 /TAXON_ID=202472 /ORGANISM="Aulacoseira subarctica , Strain CCAP 1002/5" /LENGTH=227 /DNA_ID=CAMNT_0013172893 /DNA_START=321 /DNA_END=1004 /DNA_ORIENTATION=-